MSSTVLVTGAAGFIGSNLVRHLRRRWPDTPLISYDAVTYSGSEDNLASLADDPLHAFVRGDILDREMLARTLRDHAVTAIIHLAAESHVDRSILSPLEFVRTNVEGTVVLLQEAARAWRGTTGTRFHHVSTDEVFGTLGATGRFSETSPYDPRSPYSASKAASDHFVRAWHETHGLPIVITNCTNNYGPYQFPEKLIPVVITRALAGLPVPVYGNGQNVRDWLFVDDHCEAIAQVFERGTSGETYCIGGECEVANLDLVHRVLDELDRQCGNRPGTSRQLVQFVDDRPGHDFRYAMDTGRVRELGWRPRIPLEDGLRRTVEWYLANQIWLQRALSEAHRTFERAWYGARHHTAQG
ncbi:MAG TPA: dTDP-glucose 4,6-dehydratase [Kofleriaceae bacterium]|nr:dTDP-glucose 4,6-dehydratase [Kofleriaceae bacterium]